MILYDLLVDYLKNRHQFAYINGASSKLSCNDSHEFRWGNFFMTNETNGRDTRDVITLYQNILKRGMWEME